MSDANDQELVVEGSEAAGEPEIDIGLSKALESYRRLAEVNELTEEQQEELEVRIKEIQERDVIEIDTVHEPQELTSDKKILIGPPVLTRFEKARIMGARALQLSLGAPPFIEIPADARTSLDIAMGELEKRIIPIVIRRVLPNGDYQNIPISYFK
ncbi:DNA-directed RNA polymerase, subunit K/omega [Cenarchaeum symbiosum A]|uniref:DNA-directed RNA polymerase subunit Rpo6 n=1 Tax=Cenarchaeum symbiosum (strain A) TaxID=414004 RepID=A0RUC3_CENSY|nr:DNA-directed RNA polymerase, subunit K/omega [Cenarchaeum symbiosum A]